MNRFNIEQYTRSTLEDHSLKIEEGMWESLSGELDRQERKIAFKKMTLKVAFLIIAFLSGLFPIKDGSLKHAPLVSIETKSAEDTSRANEAKPVAEVLVFEKSPMIKVNEPVINAVSNISEHTVALAKDKKIPDFIQEYFEASSTIEKVSDTEIDSLLNKVRKKLNRDKLLHQEEKWILSPTEKLLADATNAEIEKKGRHETGVLDLNHILRKFLEIESAFSN